MVTRFRRSISQLKNLRAVSQDVLERVFSVRYSAFGFLTISAMLLLVGGCHARMAKDQIAETINEMDAELTGHDYRFHFRYPGDDRLLDTKDDRFGIRDLYVPEHANVQLRLNSRDFIYTIEIPELDVYEVAVPDMSFDVRFVASPVGSHDLLGSQMCGYDHPELLGKLIVQPVADFRRTMQRLSKSPLTTP